MKYFVKIENERFVFYEGMSQEAISTMLTKQNLIYEFVSELTYQEAIESLAPKIS
jgi:hypothetical protein